jgi:hypothetical protein
MQIRSAVTATFVVLLLAASLGMAQSVKEAKTTILKASEITSAHFPERVFFAGKVAPVQLRNTGGVHFADGKYVLAGLVDNSGYATGIKQKYQGYLIAEVPLEIGGQRVNPGAYGFGFIQGGKFILMDVGADDLFQVDSHHDAEMKRPVPLQILAGSAGDSYLLYSGRNSVEFKRAE